MPQVPLATPSSSIKWSPSPPPPKKPRQLLLLNNLFPTQTNPTVASGVNYQGKINNRAIGRGNRSYKSGKRSINRKRERARDVENIALDPRNKSSVMPDPSTNKEERPRKKG